MSKTVCEQVKGKSRICRQDDDYFLPSPAPGVRRSVSDGSNAFIVALAAV